MPDLKLSEDVSHGQVYKQAGNSVSVPLVTKIARALKVALT
jgi:DNA (cytosine-5)-methyltransferase 1